MDGERSEADKGDVIDGDMIEGYDESWSPCWLLPYDEQTRELITTLTRPMQDSVVTEFLRFLTTRTSLDLCDHTDDDPNDDSVCINVLTDKSIKINHSDNNFNIGYQRNAASSRGTSHTSNSAGQVSSK